MKAWFLSYIIALPVVAQFLCPTILPLLEPVISFGISYHHCSLLSCHYSYLSFCPHSSNLHSRQFQRLHHPFQWHSQALQYKANQVCGHLLWGWQRKSGFQHQICRNHFVTTRLWIQPLLLTTINPPEDKPGLSWEQTPTTCQHLCLHRLGSPFWRLALRLSQTL